jgi:hypothetical protein
LVDHQEEEDDMDKQSDTGERIFIKQNNQVAISKNVATDPIM